MRKFSLIASVLATVVGFGAVSTASSAFAEGCLTAQNELPTLSLSHDSTVPNAGFGYDKDSYDAALAHGNTCTTTRQSLPMADNAVPNRKKPLTSNSN